MNVESVSAADSAGGRLDADPPCDPTSLTILLFLRVSFCLTLNEALRGQPETKRRGKNTASDVETAGGSVGAAANAAGRKNTTL